MLFPLVLGIDGGAGGAGCTGGAGGVCKMHI